MIKLINLLESNEMDKRFGISKKEVKKLGNWFKKQMSKDTLFPNPGYVNHIDFEAHGNSEKYKKSAIEIAKKSRKGYENQRNKGTDKEILIPTVNIYKISGKYFWFYQDYASTGVYNPR